MRHVINGLRKAEAGIKEGLEAKAGRKRATRRLTISHDDPFRDIFLQTAGGEAALEIEIEETPTHVRASRLH